MPTAADIPTTPAEHLEAALDFVRSGEGRSASLTIGGKTVDCLLVQAPRETGNRSDAGRVRAEKVAEVAIEASKIDTPHAGDAARLDGWDCMVADEGVVEMVGGFQILLTTPTN